MDLKITSQKKNYNITAIKEEVMKNGNDKFVSIFLFKYSEYKYSTCKEF